MHPLGQLPWRQVPCNCARGSCPGGSCPQANCPRGSRSRGSFPEVLEGHPHGLSCQYVLHCNYLVEAPNW